MKRQSKRLLVGITVLLLGGFVLLNVLAYNQAWAMMHFSDAGARTARPEAQRGWGKLKVLLTGVNVPRPQAGPPPEGWRETTLPGAAGVTLSAWLSERGPDAPLVVLFHGYATAKTSLVGEAEAFDALGCATLVVDFRGSGGSSESYTAIGVAEAQDVLSAVRYAEEQVPHAELVLFGRSMGAAAILKAVAELGVEPDGVIVEAVFDKLLSTVRNRFVAMRVPSFPAAELMVFWGGWQMGFRGFDHQPVEYAKSLTCPALFLHGADDPRATVSEARRVYDAVPTEKRFVEVPATGHEAYVSRCPEEWDWAVRSFLGEP
jgi:dipeptidyl aminopeptidase/acylaminoacyl peptidase